MITPLAGPAYTPELGFAGAGFVCQNVWEFSNWLPCVGIGYRFQLQPRMNLRIDFGFGLESTGFYFNFNEAY